MASIAILGLVIATLAPIVLGQPGGGGDSPYDSRDCFRTYVDGNGQTVTIYYGRCPEGEWCQVYFDMDTNGWKAKCHPL